MRNGEVWDTKVISVYIFISEESVVGDVFILLIVYGEKCWSCFRWKKDCFGGRIIKSSLYHTWIHILVDFSALSNQRGSWRDISEGESNLTESLPLPKKYEYIIYKFIQTIEEIYFIVPSSSFSRNNPPKLNDYGEKLQSSLREWNVISWLDWIKFKGKRKKRLETRDREWQKVSIGETSKDPPDEISQIVHVQSENGIALEAVVERPDVDLETVEVLSSIDEADVEAA